MNTSHRTETTDRIRLFEFEKREGFRRAEWQVQRYGLLALALVILSAGFAGLATPATVVRACAIYGFLLLAFRLAGKRTLAQMTSFDLVLVMIIGDMTQEALIGSDDRIRTVVIVVGTFILLDAALGWFKSRSTTLDHLIDGLPLVVLERGRPLRERMAREGIDDMDILTAARERHGLTRLDEIEYAVLEASGGLSIIPSRTAATVEERA
jgi:uncharacterized membrane protein YcaP (DUF421 family)